jgi:hypothetical protein
MDTGKTLFAQLMHFLPWSTFARIIARHEWGAGQRRCLNRHVRANYKGNSFALRTAVVADRQFHVGSGSRRVPL